MSLSSLNILVVKNRALGDSVIGLSALSYIKTILPRANITYGLPSWIIPLYQKVQTSSDHYLPLNFNGLKDWLHLTGLMRKKKYDLIIELHQSGRSGKFFHLYSRIFNRPYYFHNHHQDKGTFILNQGKRLPAIQRDLDACYSTLRHLNLFSSPLSPPHYLDFPPKIEVTHATHQAPRKGKVVVLGTSATRMTKMWPLENFRQLCEKILRWDSDWRFILPLSSSPMDQDLERKIRSLYFPAEVEVVKSPLEELPHLFHQCSLYIGNDTGIKHVCVALGMPTFTFFGPEEPLEWHPYSPKLHPYFFIEGLECRTRTAHFCGLQTCDSMICLKNISIERVFNKFQEICQNQ